MGSIMIQISEMHKLKTLTMVLLPCLITILLSACSQKGEQAVIQNIPDGLALGNGEGAVGQTIDVPMTLKTPDRVMGLQFDLAWDTSLVAVGKPILTSENQHMTLNAKNEINRMTVLVFSFEGKALILDANKVLSIPVTILSPKQGETPLRLTEVIVAGRAAGEIKVPVQSGKIVLKGSMTD